MPPTVVADPSTGQVEDGPVVGGRGVGAQPTLEPQRPDAAGLRAWLLREPSRQRSRFRRVATGRTEEHAGRAEPDDQDASHASGSRAPAGDGSDPGGQRHPLRDDKWPAEPDSGPHTNDETDCGWNGWGGHGGRTCKYRVGRRKGPVAAHSVWKTRILREAAATTGALNAGRPDHGATPARAPQGLLGGAAPCRRMAAEGTGDASSE